MPRARRLKAKTRVMVDMYISPSFTFLHNLYGRMLGPRSCGGEEKCNEPKKATLLFPENWRNLLK